MNSPNNKLIIAKLKDCWLLQKFPAICGSEG